MDTVSYHICACTCLHSQCVWGTGTGLTGYKSIFIYKPRFQTPFCKCVTACIPSSGSVMVLLVSHSHDNPAVTLSDPYRQLHWSYLCFVNLWQLLNPTFLCADWTMGTVPLVRAMNDPRNLLTMATFVSIATLSLYGMSEKSHKSVIVALALVIFPYIPASNLFYPVGFVVAERILYLPSMGFCMLVGYGAWSLYTTTRTGSKLVKAVVVLGLAVVLLGHSAKTVVRNRDWYSDMSLFRSAIRDNPHNGKVYNNLGHELERGENYTFAEQLFRRASQIQPDDVGAFINLGRVLKHLGRYEEAEEVWLLLFHVCACV